MESRHHMASPAFRRNDTPKTHLAPFWNCENSGDNWNSGSSLAELAAFGLLRVSGDRMAEENSSLDRDTKVFLNWQQ